MRMTKILPKVLCLWFSLSQQATKLDPCTKDDGAYVINFMIHASVTAQLLVMTYMNISSGKSYNMQEAFERYFNDIFDAANRTLEPYKVQVVGDYSTPIFEQLPLGLTPDKICQSSNAVSVISTSAKMNLIWPKTPGMGNRIMLYNCIVGVPVQKPEEISRIDDCGNLAVFHILKPQDVIKTITDTIVGFISSNSNTTDGVESASFVQNLCKYATSCAVNNDLIGKFMEGLVNIKTDPLERVYEIEGSRKFY